MAATARLSARADLDLRIVRRALEALPRVEAAWADIDRTPRQSPDDILADRVAYRDEWRDVMTRFDELQRAARAGRLTDQQSACYRELLWLAAAGLAIMHRLDLTPPAGPVRREIEAFSPPLASTSP